MEKVKIKRVSKKKQEISGKAKVLAGLSAASALTGMGMGSGQVGNVKPVTSIVSTQGQEKTIKSKIKETLKKFFTSTIGAKEAKANASRFQGNEPIPDSELDYLKYQNDINARMYGTGIGSSGGGFGGGFVNNSDPNSAGNLLSQSNNTQEQWTDASGQTLDQWLDQSAAENQYYFQQEQWQQEEAAGLDAGLVKAYINDQIAKNKLKVTVSPDGKSFLVTLSDGNTKTVSYYEMLANAQAWDNSRTNPNVLDNLPGSQTNPHIDFLSPYISGVNQSGQQQTNENESSGVTTEIVNEDPFAGFENFGGGLYSEPNTKINYVNVDGELVEQSPTNSVVSQENASTPGWNTVTAKVDPIPTLQAVYGPSGQVKDINGKPVYIDSNGQYQSDSGNLNYINGQYQIAVPQAGEYRTGLDGKNYYYVNETKNWVSSDGSVWGVTKPQDLQTNREYTQPVSTALEKPTATESGMPILEWNENVATDATGKIWLWDGKKLTQDFSSSQTGGVKFAADGYTMLFQENGQWRDGQQRLYDNSGYLTVENNDQTSQYAKNQGGSIEDNNQQTNVDPLSLNNPGQGSQVPAFPIGQQETSPKVWSADELKKLNEELNNQNGVHSQEFWDEYFQGETPTPVKYQEVEIKTPSELKHTQETSPQDTAIKNYLDDQQAKGIIEGYSQDPQTGNFIVTVYNGSNAPKEIIITNFDDVNKISSEIEQQQAPESGGQTTAPVSNPGLKNQVTNAVTGGTKTIIAKLDDLKDSFKNNQTNVNGDAKAKDGTPIWNIGWSKNSPLWVDFEGNVYVNKAVTDMSINTSNLNGYAKYVNYWSQNGDLKSVSGSTLYYMGTTPVGGQVFIDSTGNIFNEKGMPTGQTYSPELWEKIDLSQVSAGQTGGQKVLSWVSKGALTYMSPDGGLLSGKLFNSTINKITNQSERDWDMRWQTLISVAQNSYYGDSVTISWQDPETNKSVTENLGSVRFTLDILRMNGFLDANYNIIKSP